METTSRWNLYTRVDPVDLTYGDEIFIVMNSNGQTGAHVKFHNMGDDMIRYSYLRESDRCGGCSNDAEIYRTRTAMTFNATLDKLTIL